MDRQPDRPDPGLVAATWPLHECSRRFELGHLLNAAIADAIVPVRIGALGAHHVGCWECDLATNTLTWSGGVFDLFGLPRGVPVVRDEIVAFYSEPSRAVMERLRAEAIRDEKGFTLDVNIRSAQSQSLWMRLIAAPVREGGRVTRLKGLKVPLS
jgi:PAS domain-containing protein